MSIETPSVDLAQGLWAYPWEIGDHACRGMTLRDWLAGQALMGCMAAESPDVIYEPQGVAGRAYRIADAMIAERAKGGPA